MIDDFKSDTSYQGANRRRYLQLIGAGIGVTIGGTNSVSAEDTPTSDAQLAWELDTEHPIFGGASIADGTVYVADTRGNVYAVDPNSGEVDWAYDNGDQFDGFDNDIPPKYVDEVLITATWGSTVSFLDPTNGDELGSYSADSRMLGTRSGGMSVFDGTMYIPQSDGPFLGIDLEAGEARFSIEYDGGGTDLTGNPVVVGGYVLISNGVVGGDLLAYNTETEDLEWTFEPDDGGVSTPVVSGGRVYVGAGGEFYALELETGEVVWSKHIGQDTGVAATVRDGVVYATSIADSDAESDDPDYLTSTIHAMAAQTGEHIWHTQVGEDCRNAPTIAGDTVYVSHWGENAILAVDAETGDVKWQYETGHTERGHVVVSDGMLYAGSASLRFLAFDVEETGSSDGARVQLGIYNHVDDWEWANEMPPADFTAGVPTAQEMEQDAETGDNADDDANDGPDEDADDEIPGFEVASTLTAVVGALYGYTRLAESE